MAVSRENFVAAAGATVGLTGSDIRRINGLYSSGGGPSYYSPEHIDSGVYQGVSVEGRLVAIAGTHVVSRSEGVAVVGNVLTHPAHRNRGYGRLATSAVTERLLRLCPDIVLTVDPHNKPAIRAYERLGYREACQLIESTARRRDLTGIQSMLRRAVASIRGRKYGGSFVSRSL
jgi:RimJ/RimL family protein N-acetyltransferase